jgi:uncharacterized protein (TIGR00304 family)
MHFSQYLYSVKPFFRTKSPVTLYKKPTGLKPAMMGLVWIGVAVILAGFVVLFVAALSGSGGKESKTEVRGGGVVMIGPIPIIFGSDMKWASVAIVLAIVLVLVALFGGLLL